MFQRPLIVTSPIALTIIALFTAHYRPKNHALSSIDDFSQRRVAGAVVHGLLCHRGSYPVHSKPSMAQVLVLTACTICHQLVTHCHPPPACFGHARSCVELFDDASVRKLWSLKIACKTGLVRAKEISRGRAKTPHVRTCVEHIANICACAGSLSEPDSERQERKASDIIVCSECLRCLVPCRIMV